MLEALLLIASMHGCAAAGKPVASGFLYPPSMITEDVSSIKSQCLGGKVFYDDGEVLNGALVEILDSRNHRLKALVTDKTGRFCFAGTRPGKYVLRISMPQFNTIIVTVLVSPRSKSRSASFQMTLSA
ncbi:MAG TPA: carboxypeptidase-like regulatory domain-containing protein [Candidatus Acidoferrales bacterium]|nr:carboxypeptidase-like regulatory domain-containing protein [Candidatus Acidoferrales bacterium]